MLSLDDDDRNDCELEETSKENVKDLFGCCGWKDEVGRAEGKKSS